MKTKICPCCKRQLVDEIPVLRLFDVCCDYFGYRSEQLAGKTRSLRLVTARQVLIYFLKKYTSLYTTDIGFLLNRDHSTIIHSIKKVKDMIETKQYPYQDVEKIEQVLTGQSVENPKKAA